MESQFVNHLNKCRFCFVLLDRGNPAVNISQRVRHIFSDLIGLELKSTLNYSQMICVRCDEKLEELYEFHQRLHQTTKLLYQFVEGDYFGDFKDIKISSLEPNLGHFEAVTVDNLEVKIEEIEEQGCIDEILDFGSFSPPFQDQFESRTRRRRAKLKSNEVFPKGYAACPMCPKILKKNSLSEHIKMHRDKLSNQPYSCDICGYKVFRKRYLDIHMLVHLKNSLPEEYQCSFCEKKFPRDFLKRRHERKVHQTPKDKRTKYQCECGKFYNSAEGLWVHKKDIHERGEYPCSVCGLIAVSKNRLRIHFAKEHKPKLPCEVCGELVAPGRFYTLHVRKHSMRIKKSFKAFWDQQPTRDQDPRGCVTCPYCSKLLKRNSATEHIKIHENILNNVTSTCDICGFQTFRKRDLIPHMNSHVSSRISIKRESGVEIIEVDEDYVCMQCTITFDTKHQKRVHDIKEHEQKLACEVCGEMVAPGRFFINHMTKHAPRLVCPIEGCGKDFGSKTALIYHNETEHGPKLQLHCHICNGEFHTERRLKIHIRRQHETEKVQCGVPGCKHSTARKSYLAMHYKNHRDIDDQFRNELLLQLKNIKMAQ